MTFVPAQQDVPAFANLEAIPDAALHVLKGLIAEVIKNFESMITPAEKALWLDNVKSCLGDVQVKSGQHYRKMMARIPDLMHGIGDANFEMAMGNLARGINHGLRKSHQCKHKGETGNTHGHLFTDSNNAFHARF